MDLRVVVVGAGARWDVRLSRPSAAPDMELVGGRPGFLRHRRGRPGRPWSVGDRDRGGAGGSHRVDTPTAVVDFTRPDTVYDNVLVAVERGVHAVVGTTGLGRDEWDHIDQLARERGVGVIHTPNFALGAILMMRFAQEAARLFDSVEIIELHHDQKRDAPSGTALYTADLIREARREAPAAALDSVELVQGARELTPAACTFTACVCPGLWPIRKSSSACRDKPSRSVTIRSTTNASCPVCWLRCGVHEVRGVLIGLEKLLFD